MQSRLSSCFIVLFALTVVVLSACAHSDETSVTGVVTIPETMSVPEGSRLTLTIADISLADAPWVVIGEAALDEISGKPQVEFSVGYDDSKVDPKVSYRLFASIVGPDGKYVSMAEQSAPVITDGVTSGVELKMKALKR